MPALMTCHKALILLVSGNRSRTTRILGRVNNSTLSIPCDGVSMDRIARSHVGVALLGLRHDSRMNARKGGKYTTNKIRAWSIL